MSNDVEGQITIQTGAPIPRDQALRAFAAALELNGAQLIDDGDPIEIRSARNTTGLPLRSGASPNDIKTGYAIYVIPLKYISASELNTIASRVLPNTEIRYVGTQRQIIIARGSQKTIQRLRELIAMFDVSWIAAHDVSLVQVRNLEPAAVVETASRILNAGRRETGSATLRLVPNNRLGGVLIIAGSTAQIRHASALIEKLDRSAASTKPTASCLSLPEPVSDRGWRLAVTDLIATRGGSRCVDGTEAWSAAKCFADDRATDDSQLRIEQRFGRCEWPEYGARR